MTTPEIPNELQRMVLERLCVRDCKSYRRVCKSWAVHATDYVFRRVHVFNTPKSLLSALQLSRGPYRKCVRSVVYDPSVLARLSNEDGCEWRGQEIVHRSVQHNDEIYRLMEQEEKSYEEYKKSLPRPSSDESREEFAQTLYDRLAKWQGGDRFEQLLSESMKIAFEAFSSVNELVVAPCCDETQTVGILNHNFADVMPLPERGAFVRRSRENKEIARLAECALKAAFLANRKLTRLTVFDIDPTPTQGSIWLPIGSTSLQSLHVSVYSPGSLYGPAQSYSDMASELQRAANVKELILRLEPSYLLHQTIKSAPWTELRSCELIQGKIAERELKKFLLDNKDTLKSLVLGRNYIMEGSWSNLFRSISSQMRALEKLRLCGSLYLLNTHLGNESPDLEFTQRQGSEIDRYVRQGGEEPLDLVGSNEDLEIDPPPELDDGGEWLNLFRLRDV